MRLTDGRRYRRRDGQTSEPLVRDPANATFPWRAGTHTYTEAGRFVLSGDHVFDLVGAARTPASEKLICDVNLDDYRRGVAAVMWRTT